MGKNEIIAIAAADHVINNAKTRAALARRLAKAVLPVIQVNPQWTWHDAADWLNRNIDRISNEQN